MKKKVRNLLLITLMVVMSIFGGTVAYAATSQDVTVTLTPAFVGISNAPATWLIAGLTGGGTADTSTTYYSNPLGDTTPPSATVVDAECNFTVTNTSTVATTFTVNWGDFTGGDAMTNSETGSGGVGEFGAHSWYSGLLYASKVIAKATGSDPLKENHPAITDLKWGAEIHTQTDDWTLSGDQTSTITIIAVAY